MATEKKTGVSQPCEGTNKVGTELVNDKPGVECSINGTIAGGVSGVENK